MEHSYFELLYTTQVSTYNAVLFILESARNWLQPPSRMTRVASDNYRYLKDLARFAQEISRTDQT